MLDFNLGLDVANQAAAGLESRATTARARRAFGHGLPVAVQQRADEHDGDDSGWFHGGRAPARWPEHSAILSAESFVDFKAYRIDSANFNQTACAAKAERLYATR
ncbi:MAG TPA: hypothetical protein VG713_07535 [Pirellulales bacterium]|nr:hypothetical protein [Pirellulales bacterium]